MKTLQNLADREAVVLRVARLSPSDTRLWGSMSVHQMVCHLNDSYKVGLGEKTVGVANSPLPRPLMKFLALRAPMKWPKGVPTLPEVEQGKGGAPPIDFDQDVASLRATLQRFCSRLPTPVKDHPIFATMTAGDWLRWGYLHADHHLRQFGR
jgi:hypothetical protein